MKVRFVVLDPCSMESHVHESELPVTFGRGTNAGIRLGDSWVSRAHCQIDQIDGTLIVRDLGSKHGTLVNRQPVAESVLLPGDEVLIGMTSVRVAWANSQSLDDSMYEPAGA